VIHVGWRGARDDAVVDEVGLVPRSSCHDVHEAHEREQPQDELALERVLTGREGRVVAGHDLVIVAQLVPAHHHARVGRHREPRQERGRVARTWMGLKQLAVKSDALHQPGLRDVVHVGQDHEPLSHRRP